MLRKWCPSWRLDAVVVAAWRQWGANLASEALLPPEGPKSLQTVQSWSWEGVPSVCPAGRPLQAPYSQAAPFSSPPTYARGRAARTPWAPSPLSQSHVYSPAFSGTPVFQAIRSPVDSATNLFSLRVRLCLSPYLAELMRSLSCQVKRLLKSDIA